MDHPATLLAMGFEFGEVHHFAAPDTSYPHLLRTGTAGVVIKPTTPAPAITIRLSIQTSWVVAHISPKRGYSDPQLVTGARAPVTYADGLRFTGTLLGVSAGVVDEPEPLAIPRHVKGFARFRGIRAQTGNYHAATDMWLQILDPYQTPITELAQRLAHI